MHFSKILLLTSLSQLASAAPIFSIAPLVQAPATRYLNQPATAIYQIYNNSPYTLNNLVAYNLPTGVSQISESAASYCTNPFNLNAYSSCLLKLAIAPMVAGNLTGIAPIVCYSGSHPLYCNQAFTNEQVHTLTLNNNTPTSCTANIANFAAELAQSFTDISAPDPDWGPYAATLNLSNSQPDLTNCASSGGIAWQQARLLAAADFWIQQKLNYCHHHVPDWFTPLNKRSAPETQGGYCSAALDVMPGSPYYQQLARWNYSGQGTETAVDWQQRNRMWYGLDCSDYTSFLYNFAFGIRFTSNVAYQAGQRSNNSQQNLSPNEQSGGNVLDNPDAAGHLVCADNSVEVSHSCAGHGGYLSTIRSDGTRHPSDITATMLNNLHAGDLLYIAADHESGATTAQVTHVVVWTGKKVGSGTNEIAANRIAPDTLCPMSAWLASAGNWVINDSHYQGPDYRQLTPCFYANNIWGVRRVIS